MKALLARLTARFTAYWGRLDRAGRILLCALLAAGLLTILLKVIPRAPKTLPERPETAVPVEVIRVVPENRPDLIVLPGLVLADTDAKLAAEKAGRIVEILAERGQSVTNGQVLLRIDDRTARIAFEDAARNRERFEKLAATGAVSQKDLDEVRKAYDLAETALSYCTVRSPADGIVNERYVDEGEYLLPATPVFDVLSIHPVRITLDIPERSLRRLEPGETLTFQAAALPGRLFTGTVAYVSAKAGTANNAFRAELKTANPDGALRPGMIAEVNYLRGLRANTIALPLDAIVPQRGDTVVFVVRDGRAVRRIVHLDRLLGREAVILSGLAEGERVVVRGNRLLADGARIRIQE